ncbi:MAG: hypothetical protein ACQETD_09030 [Pseudomonadota bacterium]
MFTTYHGYRLTPVYRGYVYLGQTAQKQDVWRFPFKTPPHT